MSTPLLVQHRVQGAKVALVFVHGFSGDPSKTWGQFPAFVAADSRLNDWDIFSIGYTTRLVPDIVGIWSADAPLDRLALLLSTIASTPPLSDYRSLAIVAHSMGGLILQRALLDSPELSTRTSHVLLYGTPSGGLAKAGPFSFIKRQVRDMAEKSDFVTTLRSRWNASFEPVPTFRFTTVAGDQDEFVPSVSSLDPFPAPSRAVVPGNHLEIVKPKSSTDLSVQVLFKNLIGDAAPAGPRNAAALALESRDFVNALRMLEEQKAELDSEGLVQLALALEGTGRQDEAIALLEKYAGSDTDSMGVLAGRLKRRWLAGHRRADAERALSLYQRAFEISTAKSDHAQAYYHGVNVAFMELAYGSDHEAAKAMAAQVLNHCALASDGLWKTAAEGEANLILGQTVLALDRYRRALTLHPKPREIASMFQQALRLADLMGDDAASLQLTALYSGQQDAAAV
jgi:pimeloyl-ACP methyl ester carboxylesterase